LWKTYKLKTRNGIKKNKARKINSRKCNAETILSYKEYKVITGLDNQGAYIQLLKDGTAILERSGGDGNYSKLDTVDFNRDGHEDFVFSYLFEDYFNLEYFYQKTDLKYELKSLGNYNYPRCIAMIF